MCVEWTAAKCDASYMWSNQTWSLAVKMAGSYSEMDKLGEKWSWWFTSCASTMKNWLLCNVARFLMQTRGLEGNVLWPRKSVRFLRSTLRAGSPAKRERAGASLLPSLPAVGKCVSRTKCPHGLTGCSGPSDA